MFISSDCNEEETVPTRMKCGSMPLQAHSQLGVQSGQDNTNRPLAIYGAEIAIYFSVFDASFSRFNWELK